jgi:hypothetical protein
MHTDTFGSRQGSVGRSYEQGDELSASIQDGML